MYARFRRPTLPPAIRHHRPFQVGILLLACLVCFGVAMAASTLVWEGRSSYVTITVAPGDTLWEIAEGRYPEADIRSKVDQIQRANGLRDPVVQPGEQLQVPTR